MGQHLVDRHWLPLWGTLGNVGAEWILHMQFALLLQDQNRHSGKLLGGGAEIKHRVGRVGHLVIPVGHAIATAQEHLAILCDQHRTAELLVCDLVREQAIDVRGNYGGLRRESRLRGGCRLPQVRSHASGKGRVVCTRSQQGGAARNSEQEHQEQVCVYQQARASHKASQTSWPLTTDMVSKRRLLCWREKFYPLLIVYDVLSFPTRTIKIDRNVCRYLSTIYEWKRIGKQSNWEGCVAKIAAAR